jgi:hypothetical protein
MMTLECLSELLVATSRTTLEKTKNNDHLISRAHKLGLFLFYPKNRKYKLRFVIVNSREWI